MPIGIRSWPSWIGVFFIWIISLLPRSLRNALANWIASKQVNRQTSTNTAVDINIQACFPELDAEARHVMAIKYTAAHLQALMLSPRNWWCSDNAVKQFGQLHNREALDAAIATQRPVVLLITHSAALDAGLLAIAPYYPLQGIYNPLENKVLDWLVFKGRHRFGATATSRGSGFRQLIKGLKAGKLLCYLSDEDLGKEGSVFAPFFGHQKATLAMLPRLVKATNALVVPMIALHNANTDGVDVHFFDALENYPNGDEVASATIMNRAIEDTIKLEPHQFTWKLRIFKTCPDDKGTRYGQIERGEIGVGDL